MRICQLLVADFLQQSIIKCLNTKWIRSGYEAYPVDAGLHIGDGVALLIESNNLSNKLSHRAIQIANTNLTPLLLALGHSDHLRTDTIGKIDRRFIDHFSFIPSLFGLLLYKLGYKKGDYQMNAPFLIGRMLALADLLHKEYCNHVRDKSIPSRLLGNSIIQNALTNPESGLARLTERLPLYQSWAYTVQGDNVGLPKWVLQNLSKTSEELSKLEIPKRCNDIDKAQMLLGYLARIEKESIQEEQNNE